MTLINVSPSVNNAEKINTDPKNLNLNINVKVPELFSKLFYVSIITSFVLLMGVSAIISLQLQELRMQVESLMLMCQDKGNQNNRVEELNRFQRATDYNDSVNLFTFEHSNHQIKVRDDGRTDTVTLMPYNQTVSDQSISHENNAIERNVSRSTYYKKNTIKRNASNLSKRSKRLISKLIKMLFLDFNNKRNFPRFEMKNYVTTEGEISSDHELNRDVWDEPHMIRLRRMVRDTEKRQSEEKNETRRREESEKQRQSVEEGEKRQSEEKNRTRRRSEKKGEKRRQNRRGHKHNHRSKPLLPLVATFKGGMDTLDFNLTRTPTGSYNIGPWVKSEHDNHQYEFTKFHLVEGNMAIEVAINGLYMISVQITYYGTPPSYSYGILLNSEGASKKEMLITCSAVSSENGNRVSCYTSIIKYLKKRDRLSLQQVEKNRALDMKEGYSQIQITLLANDRRRSM
ncbi:uncharacterized protein LOC112454124 [Temnothorax curvispinosus]|uniref:Uncharacterized protein LOC112454124 n=1 Tax=Temnothorax curvispinosus TaxID=300111 RepID=A0A6J1PPW9_9HYME|nr:uncharacterized protein LOC112454124 [Temnothorax curvispinosus]